jgi:hypothetical protein
MISEARKAFQIRRGLQHGAHPTPEEIAERAAEIRRHWSPEVENDRRASAYRSCQAALPVVSDDFFSGEFG